MGLPSVTIQFASAANSAIQRGQKGTVAVILRDATASGPHIMTAEEQIPTDLGTANKATLKQAFMGYVNRPRRVLAYVSGVRDPEAPDEDAPLEAALAWLATQSFDYLAAPADVTEDETAAIKAWITERRTVDHAIYKAVLPNTPADSEAVINFTTDGIKVGETTYDAAGYCSRIAGLIAGTPMTISCTYAPLPEVSDVTRLSRGDMDAAIDGGEFIIFHDGEKVKVGRGVNSLKTLSAGQSDIWKKIKIVEALDMIRSDIRRTAEDTYIGKYANSYDNKLVLCTAIRTYLMELERSGLLQEKMSSVGIDVAEQKKYLDSKGVDTSNMTDQQIKEANTGSKVFIRIGLRPLDVIEDIFITIDL